MQDCGNITVVLVVLQISRDIYQILLATWCELVDIRYSSNAT